MSVGAYQRTATSHTLQYSYVHCMCDFFLTNVPQIHFLASNRWRGMSKVKIAQERLDGAAWDQKMSAMIEYLGFRLFRCVVFIISRTLGFLDNG